MTESIRRRGGGTIPEHDLQQRQALEIRLAEQRNRMQDLLANVPAIVWEIYRDPQRRQENFVSRFVSDMLDYSPEQWLADHRFWLAIVYDDDRDTVERRFNELLDTGEPMSIEYRCLTARGKPLWVETKANAIREADGQIVGARCVTIDITRHKRAQRALRRRAKQLVHLARRLKRSNQELDQFAYITSHDLRAPLRGIANLSRWIEEDMGDKFTPEAHKQMELLRGRVHRMEALIAGLLEYSRIGRVEVKPEPVDVATLIREVIDLLDPPAGFEIDIQPDMPRVVTQRLRLQQVVMNLISNAIKHHDRPAQGRLEIRSRDAGEFFEFTFTDNGPGIAPQYHEKIFALFQTLVARDKLEATGVGLSLVKKIVEGHGGSIKVESREGAGATFRFTWPKGVTGA